MRKFLLFPILVAAALVPASAKKPANTFVGRWDLNIVEPRRTYPDWLEVTEKNGLLMARYQPSGGASKAIQGIKIVGARLVLTINPAAANRPEQVWDLTVNGVKITGVQKNGDAESGKVEGVRAPALKRKMPRRWTDPEPLFNGKDLTGWEPIGAAANNKWIAKDGELVNPEKGANLKTTRKFDDFKLHIETMCMDEHCNSGIYLRGRYEIQVGTEGGTQDSHEMGAVYGMVAPSVKMPLGVGQWQVFDITFAGRTVTVERNGTKIQDNVEIPGFTGGALDANEGEPGPFFLQGDHGPIKYRNITISVPKK
jgi:hypothetical protein